MEREERIFLAGLGQANQDLGRYVVRVLEEQTGLGVTEYTRSLGDVEYGLGLQLLNFGHQLVQRAEARSAVVIESVALQAKVTQQADDRPARTEPSVPEC